jgi:broad specificity phosphatase PhoE
MKNFKKFIFIARHGERADMSKDCDLNLLKCGRYDTELTENGKCQAFQAGETIKNFLKENKKDYTIHNTSVISSPFARTIITANELIKGLCIPEKIPLFIENGLCEHLNKKWYPQHPNSFLLSLKDEMCEKKEYLNSQIKGLECRYQNITEMPIYPETHQECELRFKNVYNKIINHHFHVEEKDILILVTHFFPVEIFLRHFYNKEHAPPLEYCLTFAFYYNEESMEPIFVNQIYPKI